MNNWINSEEVPEDTFGFIYIIENKLTGQYYIGKKQLFSYNRVKIGKREKLKTKTRKTFKIKVTEKPWRDYWGSNIQLLEDIERLGVENFTKSILMFVNSKKLLGYYEMKYQIDYNVLVNPLSYNSNIAGKYFCKDFA